MKIRMGFVSNSSVSSFIILVRPYFANSPQDIDFIASEENITKAKEYGFTETRIVNPFRYSEFRSVNNAEPIEREGTLGLVFTVLSNQIDVLYFLVKNNIPFRASVHYKNHYYCYGKDWDYVLRAENFGYTMCMYGEKRTEQLGEWDLEPVRKMPKDEWLKEQEELWGFGKNED